MLGRLVLILVCGLALAAPSAARDRPASGREAKAPSIIGGSEQQRALLAQLVAGMHPDSLRSIRIAELEPTQWAPHPAGAVGIAFSAPLRLRGSLRSSWQAAILAGNFRDASVAQQLPPVYAYQDGMSGSRIWPGWPSAPPSASNAGVQTLAAKIRAAIPASARLAALSIRRPDGMAPDIVLKVRHPAAFLRHRAGVLLRQLDFYPNPTPQLEGVALRLVDRTGHFVWEATSSTRVAVVAERFRPDLINCDPIPHSRPVGIKGRGKPCPAP
jgi:hypothetical protein